MSAILRKMVSAQGAPRYLITMQNSLRRVNLLRRSIFSTVGSFGELSGADTTPPPPVALEGVSLSLEGVARKRLRMRKLSDPTCAWMRDTARSYGRTMIALPIAKGVLGVSHR